MEYKVMSQKELAIYMSKTHKQKTVVISISDIANEGQFVVVHTSKNNICGCIAVYFDDVDNGPTAITEQTAKNIVSFVDATYAQTDKIIVQCGAGISRSAGVCAAIMKAKESDDSPIFNNPRFCPNMLCYRLVLQAFMEKGE